MDVRATGVAVPPKGTDAKLAAEGTQAQLTQLAHQFEAMFLSEMLRGMRDSMLSDESDQGLGNETMTDTFDSELGLSLSKQGGLGLANMMLEALVRQGTDATKATVPVAPHVVAAYTSAASAGTSVVPTSTPAAATAGIAEAVSPVATAPAATAVPVADAATHLTSLPGTVTSGFGWRPDPFTGRAQFHAGTDIRMAYGQGVQAVAGGTVSSVGEKTGYGLTVVIDHGNGLETRYAHLSSATVRPGEVVEAGQVVAQSGNSGRSTGPHLHLEARQHGRAVEVASLLKDSGLRADSYADRTLARSGHED